MERGPGWSVVGGPGGRGAGNWVRSISSDVYWHVSRPSPFAPAGHYYPVLHADRHCHPPSALSYGQGIVVLIKTLSEPPHSASLNARRGGGPCSLRDIATLAWSRGASSIVAWRLVHVTLPTPLYQALHSELLLVLLMPMPLTHSSHSHVKVTSHPL